MTHLSNDTLNSITTVSTPSYDRSRVSVGIAHFGVGNFHRAHQAVYLDRCLAAPGSEQWGILGIGISDGDAAQDKARRFAQQDGLFTVTESDPSGTSTSRVIGSLVRYLHAPADPEAVLAALSDPALRIVTLTITEGGYFTDERTGAFDTGATGIRHDAGHEVPVTVFGYLVRALARRRDAGTAAFTVVSCDNLPGNGEITRRAVVGLAQLVDPQLASWIEGRAAFPSSMVDRVVPYVSGTDRDRLNAATGVDDLLPVATETYLQWVLEDHFPAGRPDLAAAGVQLTGDVTPYERVKLRLLNASHVLLAYPSLLIGHRVVHEAMADPAIRDLVDAFTTRDAIPLLEGTVDVDLTRYKDDVIERFGNPAINDQLLRIATDGAAKIPTFHAPTITHQLATGGDCRRSAFLLACYQRYLRGTDDTGAPFDVTEPTLGRAARDLAQGDDGAGVLDIGAFAELGLAEHEDFADCFHTMLASLQERGTVETIRRHVTTLHQGPA